MKAKDSLIAVHQAMANLADLEGNLEDSAMGMEVEQRENKVCYNKLECKCLYIIRRLFTFTFVCIYTRLWNLLVYYD